MIDYSLQIGSTVMSTVEMTNKLDSSNRGIIKKVSCYNEVQRVFVSLHSNKYKFEIHIYHPDSTLKACRLVLIERNIF